MLQKLAPLTVVIPAKNSSDTLPWALRSTLIATSSQDRILILVETGDDSTISSVLPFLKSSRVKLIEVAPDMSFAEKLNYGVELSDSELVSRMDADDVVLPWRFLLQKWAMRNPEISLVSTTAIIFGKDLRPFPVLPQLPLKLQPSELPAYLLTTNPIMHPTVTFRKTAFNIAGGYINVAGEDLHLWVRFAVKGLQMKRSGIPSLLYRYRRSSMSRDENVKKNVALSTGIAGLRDQLRGQVSLGTQNPSLLSKLKRLLVSLDLGKNN